MKELNTEQQIAHSGSVFCIDDDPALCDSLRVLADSVNLPIRTYLNPTDFLEKYDPHQSGCLLLDIRLPKMNGLALQNHLKNEGISLPIIFLSGFADVSIAVQAMKAGAIDFFTKPYDPQILLDSIYKAIEIDKQWRSTTLQKARITELFNSLTQREYEIAQHLAMGRQNKIIAPKLGISAKTVELHRSKIMRKLKIRSIAELVTLLNTDNTSVK